MCTSVTQSRQNHWKDRNEFRIHKFITSYLSSLLNNSQYNTPIRRNSPNAKINKYKQEQRKHPKKVFLKFKNIYNRRYGKNLNYGKQINFHHLSIKKKNLQTRKPQNPKNVHQTQNVRIPTHINTTINERKIRNS